VPVPLCNMEAVVLIGIQGSGKSTFCRDRFGGSHVHINLDTLKTRHREDRLLQECLDEKRPFVVDNTNPTTEVRRRYI
jgi:predicted kinase